MGEEKIADFYDDEVKVDCDAASTAKAYYLRSLSTETGLAWQARRWGRFLVRLGRGVGPAGARAAAVGARPQGGDASEGRRGARSAANSGNAQKQPCGLSN